MTSKRELISDLGRSPDDGSTLNNGDQVGDLSTFRKDLWHHDRAVVTTADGQVIGNPEES